MWPKYLDLDAKSCTGILRKVELEAYSKVVTALRAQGELTKERRKVLNDLGNILNIPVDRHKAEIRRAVNDELLNTIALSICGDGRSEAEWAKEGRRIIPLLNRATPITAFTPIADSGADEVAKVNKNLTSPLNTKSESKRRCLSPEYVSRYSYRTPPKDLSEMVTRVKGENEENHCVVRSPSIAMPPPPPGHKSYTQYFGGDVVILPSGKAVRLHEDKLNEINEALDAANKKRKRKHSDDTSYLSSPSGTSSRPPFEVISRSALMAMMPPPMAPPSSSSKMGILGNHLIGPRASTPRGRRGGNPGGRGGRRPKTPKIPPTSTATSTTVNQQNSLAVLAMAINHQQEQEAAASAAAAAAAAAAQGSNPAEPPQVAITPPKVVVVTTPSGTVLRTSTAATMSSNSVISAVTSAEQRLATSATTAQQQPQQQPHVVTTVSAASSPLMSSTPKASRPQTTVKLKVGDSLATSPMKVFPVGARILPKTVSTSGGPTGSGNAPIYMLATSMGQNLMRVARTTQSGQTVTLTSGQRVVTVNTASLRPHGATAPGGGVIRPGNAAAAAIRALQPRGNIVGSSGQRPSLGLSPGNASGTSKPSVIVVQRSHGNTTAKAIVTKDGIPGGGGGQRIIQTKTAMKQPIVIVSKPSLASSSFTTTSSESIITTSFATSQSPASANQNVIVLDLSQEQMQSTGGSNVLSDILQMTGIMGEEEVVQDNYSKIEPEAEPVKEVVQRHVQLQHRPTTATTMAATPSSIESSTMTTLQKVPGESSWIVLDSNGRNTSTNRDESQDREPIPKMDIFSQALASADIGEFEANNVEVTTEIEKDCAPPKTNSSSTNVLFASPHDVMPTRPKGSTGEYIDDITSFLANTSNNDKSVVVEEVGDEVVTDGEVISMEGDFNSS